MRRLLPAACIAILAACAEPRPVVEGPNVVLLLADDLGWGDLGCFGGGFRTPALDALAAAGVTCTDAYASAPVCNPSRAGLVTGRYQQRFGQELNSQRTPPRGAPRLALPRSERTLAERLHDTGYETAWIGKWQLGLGRGHHPLDRGFDTFFGHDAFAAYLPEGAADLHEVPAVDPGVRGPVLRGRDEVSVEGHLTARYADEAVAFLRREHSAPFLLCVSFFAPHVPLQVLGEHYDRHPELPHDLRVYAGLVAALDDAVGRVLDALAAEGLAGETLVLFASDNGAAHYADFDGARNGPLAGHKGTLYEGGLRVPFLARWPGRLPAGRRIAAPVGLVDLVPTVLAAAGREVPRELDGVDLLPLLTGEREGVPRAHLFWRSGANAAVRSVHWKLLRGADGRARLFDLDEDPREEHDVASQRADVRRELEVALDAWLAELPPAPEAARTRTTEHGGDRLEWSL